MAADHTTVRVERQDLFEDQLQASNTRSVRRASGLVLADNSGIDGDKRVYEDLSEAAQSRLASLHNLMTSCLIGL